MLRKVVTGGQTGVDQAAWDVAIRLSLEQGGWVPEDGSNEDGPIPSRYRFERLDRGGRDERTRRNVRDSDATLILSRGLPTGGSALTWEEARRMAKPVIVVDLGAVDRGASVRRIRGFLREHRVGTLNVAGPPRSLDPDAGSLAEQLLLEVLPGLAPRHEEPEETDDVTEREGRSEDADPVGGRERPGPSGENPGNLGAGDS